jgi:putative transposase
MRRKVIFSDNEFYHIFNKTISKEIIFDDKRSLGRALNLIDYYRYRPRISFSKFQELNPDAQVREWNTIASSVPLVNIHAFGLMPNHFHFLLEQTTQNGIKFFISNFQNSFAKYFNKRKDREGGLFKSRFKGVWLNTIEEVLHESRYIHLNPVTSYLLEIERLDTYPYTSFSTYMGRLNYGFVTTDLLSSHFKSREDHRKFVYDRADYQRTLGELKHLALE